MQMKLKLEYIFVFLNIILYATIKYLEFSFIILYKKISRKLYSKHENMMRFWGLISFRQRDFSSTKKIV